MTLATVWRLKGGGKNDLSEAGRRLFWYPLIRDDGSVGQGGGCVERDKWVNLRYFGDGHHVA